MLGAKKNKLGVGNKLIMTVQSSSSQSCFQAACAALMLLADMKILLHPYNGDLKIMYHKQGNRK